MTTYLTLFHCLSFSLNTHVFSCIRVVTVPVPPAIHAASPSPSNTSSRYCRRLES